MNVVNKRAGCVGDNWESKRPRCVMTDSKPSTSGRFEMSEKERQAMGAIWVYVQPMAMYNHIQQRQQSQVGLSQRLVAELVWLLYIKQLRWACRPYF